MEVSAYTDYAAPAVPFQQYQQAPAEQSLMQRTHERVIRQMIVGFLFIVAASFVMAGAQPTVSSSSSSTTTTTPAPAGRPLTITMELSPAGTSSAN